MNAAVVNGAVLDVTRFLAGNQSADKKTDCSLMTKYICTIR